MWKQTYKIQAAATADGMRVELDNARDWQQLGQEDMKIFITWLRKNDLGNSTPLRGRARACWECISSIGGSASPPAARQAAVGTLARARCPHSSPARLSSYTSMKYSSVAPPGMPKPAWPPGPYAMLDGMRKRPRSPRRINSTWRAPEDDSGTAQAVRQEVRGRPLQLSHRAATHRLVEALDHHTGACGVLEGTGCRILRVDVLVVVREVQLVQYLCMGRYEASGRGVPSSRPPRLMYGGS